MLAFGQDPWCDALHAYAETLPRPKAILVVSAHSISSDRIHILSTAQNRIQYDFAGFPPELYKVQYPCPGSPEIAGQLAYLFTQSGFEVKLDEEGLLDHGIWVPLLHLYPKGDIPVVRVSLPLNLLPAQILKMGHTLSSLREQGVLLIGSGGAVHNLRELKWSGKRGEGAKWAREFESWIVASLQTKNVEAIMNYEDHPDFARSHPSDEHFLPLLFTVGSALPGDELDVLFKGIEYDTISMLSFALTAKVPATYH